MPTAFPAESGKRGGWSKEVPDELPLVRYQGTPGTEQVLAAEVCEGFVLVSAMHISASVFVNDHESGFWNDIQEWLEGTIAPWEPDE